MLVKWDGLREFWSKGEDRIGHLSNQWEVRVSRMAPFGAQSGRYAGGWMQLVFIIWTLIIE